MTDTPTSAKYSFPHIGCAKSSEQQYDCFYAECKNDVLFYDRQCFSGNPYDRCDLADIIIHQHNVGCLDCCIRSHASHGNADIRSCQYRSIIDAVSDKCQFFFLRFFPAGGVLPVPPYLPAAVLHVLHQYQALLPLP